MTSVRSGRAGALVAVVAALVCLAPSVAAAPPPAPAPAATASPFCPPAAPGHRTCLGLALARTLRHRTVATTGARPNVESPGGGYAPQDIQAAYRLGGIVGTNGASQLVGIVDAFDDPTAASDLATYRAFFGLPACAVGVTPSSCLRKVDETGGTAYPQPNSGWAQEISLDLDAVSTACPLCRILLVEASGNDDTSLITAIRTATALGATVLSLSFGGCESSSGDFDATFAQANRPIAVASGDNGYFTSSQASADNPLGCAAGTPEYPASSPDVTAVGGTRLTPSASPRGWTETAWAYSANGAGGSGCSSFEQKPSWQSDAGCGHRTAVDVAADADPATGLSVFNSYSDSGWTDYGGTSLAAPLIAGIDALANAPAAAVDGQVWYTSAAVHDVTGGSNASPPGACSPSYLCNAVTGYDGPTGMGSPDGAPIVDPALTPLPATSQSTAIPLSWSPPPNVHPASYRVWAADNTNGAGPWLQWVSTAGTATTFYGFAGHTYAFAVQYFLASGSSNGPPRSVQTTTAIAPTATRATPFTSLGAVDGVGAVHPGSSPPVPTFGFGWDIARGMTADASGNGGVVLDGWGGLHAFGDSAAPSTTGYWPGWDIATAVASLPGHQGGYVLDGWGGLHQYALGTAPMPTAPAGNAYWAGWSIARAVATFDDGTGGVTLDGWGGVHAFAASSTLPRPLAATTTAYWAGWDIARSLVLLPGSTSANYRGYVLDGWGGVHPFAAAGTSLPPALSGYGFYKPGWDIARAIVLEPGSSTAGYVVDGFGGFQAFGGAPTVVTPNYGVNGPDVRAAAIA